MSLDRAHIVEQQLAAIGLHGKLKERLRRVQRYIGTQWRPGSTFLLATEVLGYDRLTESFHKPLLDEWDRRDLAYDQNKYHKDELDLWARDHYKTTCVIARCAKRQLQDPARNITWYHAVEEKAVESARELGHHYQTNMELRELMPEGMKPPPISKARKWNSAGKFRFPCNVGRKDPTLFATGVGSESTGGHSRIVVLDDIIGQKTIDDSLMPKVRSWLGTTVNNVLETGGQQYAIGTIWDEDDVWNDFIQSTDCDVTQRGSGYQLYLEGKAKLDDAPVLYTIRELKKKRNKPGWTDYSWSCQMENNPIPDSARRWDSAKEQRCTLEEAMQGKGVVVVLSDPAPVGIRRRSTKDKERGDAGKDFWPVSVVRLRQMGDFWDLILLDGDASQRWSNDDGFRVACRFMKDRRFPTRYFFNESYSGDSWTIDFERVARDEGVRAYKVHQSVSKGGRKVKEWVLPTFAENYSANQKNLRMEKLASLNNGGNFFICETCSDEFLHGDPNERDLRLKDRVGFLKQSRKWMPLPGNRNNLRWDDHFELVARGLDRAVQSLPMTKAESGQRFVFEEEDEDSQYQYMTRYCPC